MTKKNYLETLKSVLGPSILHYSRIHGQLYKACLVSSFVQCSDFISAIHFVCRHICYNQKFSKKIILV